uniref:Uncharacterized protein n=1 Tax=Arundo donax TaxID=35708 RepID=A0A0A9HM10_ARUDO
MKAGIFVKEQELL